MIFRLLGCLIALLAHASAQSEEAPVKKTDSAIQVRLLAEYVPDNLGNVQMRFAEDVKSEAIELPTNQLSKPIPCAVRQMVLTTEGGIPLCKVSLPEQGKSFAVILVTAKPSGYSPIIVRSDDPAFKAGDVYFINRSDKTVLGKLGGTPLILSAGSTSKNRPSQPVDNTYYDISFATRDEAGDRLISSTRWPIDNHLRSYVFFFTDMHGKTTFRAVDEFMPPPQ